MSYKLDKADAAARTYATAKLNAAAVLSASYLRDMYDPETLGFISTAYTAAHEAMELLLKLYLRRGLKKPEKKTQGHDLGKLFMMWDEERRTKAELEYQCVVLADINDNRINSPEAHRAVLGFDWNSALPPDYSERKAEHRETFQQYKKKLLHEGSPTVRDVLNNLDVRLGARNITWLCELNYQHVIKGFPCKPEAYYPDELLSVEWGRFAEATKQGSPLGVVEAFLKKEGTNSVFVGLRYLDEDEETPEKESIIFGGPFHSSPGKMILMAKSLVNVVWLGIRRR